VPQQSARLAQALLLGRTFEPDRAYEIVGAVKDAKYADMRTSLSRLHTVPAVRVRISGQGGHDSGIIPVSIPK